MSQFNRKFTVSAAVIALVALALMAVAGSAAAVALQQVKDRGYIRIGVANEIPYDYVDASGTPKGVGPEVAMAVLKSIGISEFQWVVMPFGSLIPAVKAGRIDMAAAEMNILPQRCQAVDFVGPDTTAGEGLLVLNGNPSDVHSYEIFAKNPKLKVGILSGGDQLDMMQALGVPMSQMVMIKNNVDAINAVASGRVDAFAATGQSVVQLAEKSDKLEPAKNFKDPVVDGKEVRSYDGFAFNEASDSLRTAFAKAFQKFKHTDAWEKIMSHYGFSEEDIKKSYTRTVKERCGDAYDATQG